MTWGPLAHVPVDVAAETLTAEALEMVAQQHALYLLAGGAAVPVGAWHTFSAPVREALAEGGIRAFRARVGIVMESLSGSTLADGGQAHSLARQMAEEALRGRVADGTGASPEAT